MGAPKKPGTVFYLGRVRHTPGLHSAELRDFLTRFATASQAEKLSMLQILLDGGGLERLQAGPAEGEDEETRDLLDSLLGGL